jgi:DNA-binding CsgD family transcriptional regulator
MTPVVERACHEIVCNGSLSKFEKVGNVNIDLDSILSEFSSAEGDPTRAFEVLKRIGRLLGYDHAIADYSKSASATSRVGVFHASTHPDEWRGQQGQLTVQEVLRDPIVTHLRTRIDPIFWSRRNYEQAGLSSFYDRFRDHGLGSGIALSIRGFNGDVLSVGLSNSQQQENVDNTPVMQMGALYLSATAMLNRMRLPNTKDAKSIKLTPREIECLQWAREGKTGWEIAQILGISHATSIFHMKNAVAKLEASNKTHAVIVAVERGLIN